MKSISLLAIAGLAASAAAQGVTLSFSANTTTANIGDTVSWTVSASFTGYTDATAYYGGHVGSWDASDAGLGTSGNFANLLGFQGVAATSNGASVGTINIFNSALLGSDDPANPIAIFTFDVVAGAAGDLSYGASGISTVFPDDGIFTLGDEYTASTTSDTVHIVPAPGAFALLGLGGLAAARRRR
ncbi:MAG: hypothetical protein H6810_08160 [Phycisphaeraceae bacterium]|nr:MAG: hypothetical protein H6810_08160 [Phycisphaeraceae bacterium]